MSDMPNEPILEIYNTLTRSKERFAPINRENVRMYVCGPTVYDYAHIGNARPAIVFDVLFRLLRHVYGADHVTYVRNITDVDDKINARAARDYPNLPLNEAIARVTEKTAAQYFKDVAALGCLEPSVQPRATDHIAGMVEMIQTLIDRGHAYIATGQEGREVLFAVDSMPEYGRLSGRKLEEQQAGARVAVEAHKKNPADFVLWKESAEGQPGWPGRFTAGGSAADIVGRPGWHIECSVMSAVNLGEIFDIHGGGLDLIFPHHENEIAQSVCAHGRPRMANYWMHNGFLQVEGRKMSKSEGNFVTIRELLEPKNSDRRKWPGEVLRLAMLMTHYREPIDFSAKRLEEASHISLKFANLVRRFVPEDGAVLPGVLDALADDLNVPLAIQAIRKVSGKPEDQAASIYFLGLEDRRVAEITAKVRRERRAGIRDSLESAYERVALLELGLSESQVKGQLEKRLALIRDKNWAEADRIRDELLQQGIQLKDGKDPATGERVTNWEVKR